MKHTKKLLALLLALILGLGLGVPAMAVDWADFYLISPATVDLTVPFGEDIELSVLVNIPAGTEATYQWYRTKIDNGNRIADPTTSDFTISPGDAHYPYPVYPDRSVTQTFYCRVTAFETDAGGRYIRECRFNVTVIDFPVVADWENFRIDTQPQSQDLKSDSNFTLSVGVNIPAGIEVEYQWCHNRVPIANAAASSFSCSPGDPCYPKTGVRANRARAAYHCRVTGIERNAQGVIVATKTLESDAATVTTPGSGNILDILYALIVFPWVGGFSMSAGLFLVTMGIGGIPALFLFPVAVFGTFVMELNEVFGLSLPLPRILGM